ncbi:CPBP family intramembrane glutamic endopeptidase [Salinirubrum litoreum]|uniref:CPBP family intramembrane glutamic endopeptidase n=1 Tax=Salinirubrum litoreum TaxID=1126234 RepID=A0ABD5RFU0_9EURY|nr:type II CAAX endopeptidase family protein [Salinirubrum litoreum]
MDTEDTGASSSVSTATDVDRLVESPAVRGFTVFVLGTLGFSWSLWALLVADLVPPSATTPLILVGGFGPLVGALLTLRVQGASIRAWLRSNLRLRLPVRWYLVALLLPPLLVGLAGLVHAGVFGARLDLGSLPPAWVYPAGLVLVFFVGGGQEELGWRAFAVPVLQERFSALLTSLLVGVVWVCWHLPLFVVPGSSQAGIPLAPYAVAVVSVSVVFTWLYNSTASVLPAMLLHGGINPIAQYFPTGGADAIRTVEGYGSYALVVLGLALVVLSVSGAASFADERVRLSALTGSSETAD